MEVKLFPDENVRGFPPLVLTNYYQNGELKVHVKVGIESTFLRLAELIAACKALREKVQNGE